MKKMTAQKKACMIIVIIWIALGALLLTLSLTIGNSNPDTRPFLTVLRNIYITAVPVILSLIHICIVIYRNCRVRPP